MNLNIKYGITRLLPLKLAKKYSCIPVMTDKNNKLTVAFGNPEASLSIEAIKNHFREMGFADIEIKAAEPREIKRLINTYYTIEHDDLTIERTISKLKQNQDFEGLYRFILDTANSMEASDIHINFENENFIIKYRIRGILKTLTIIGEEIGENLIRIIKVNSNLEISKIRAPKDARIKYISNGKNLDIRVSIVSGISNEKVSLRILNPANIPKNLEELGLEEHEKSIISRTLKLNNGFVLICGPTGSGKTTTLRCFLNEINDGKTHIVSIENPIEYTLDGITQVQVDETLEDGFGLALRSIVRQDPDVIYIGEIRDYESADVATKASLTGHLVFSTLHTRSARTAVERLENMGIHKTTLASSLNLVINQRLTGVLCLDCKTSIEYQGEDIPALELQRGDIIWESNGCKNCSYSGISKNIPLMELIVFDNTTRIKVANDTFENLSFIEDSIQSKIKRMFKNGNVGIDEALKYLWY